MTRTARTTRIIPLLQVESGACSGANTFSEFPDLSGDLVYISERQKMWSSDGCGTQG
jgi:hypothetical protein